jgi:hypothetical protein
MVRITTCQKLTSQYLLMAVQSTRRGGIPSVQCRHLKANTLHQMHRQCTAGQCGIKNRVRDKLEVNLQSDFCHRCAPLKTRLYRLISRCQSVNRKMRSRIDRTIRQTLILNGQCHSCLYREISLETRRNTSMSIVPKEQDKIPRINFQAELDCEDQVGR